MQNSNLSELFNRFKFGEDNYHNLMKNKVHNIFLISSIFDAYILEQDGRLSEQLIGEYKQLNLSLAPKIFQTSYENDYLKEMASQEFDLVIIVSRIGQHFPSKIHKKIKEKFPYIPILLLLNRQSYIELFNLCKEQVICFKDVFIWNGNSRIFLAMIKYLEDLRNVDYDVKCGNVGVILIVESSPDYYSTFLPLLYSEILEQTQLLISQEVNELNKRLRMRVRPKLLLATTKKEAEVLYQKYKKNLFCVISNINLRDGEDFDYSYGKSFLNLVRNESQNLPILIQSADTENRIFAEEIGADFVEKDSIDFIKFIQDFVRSKLGFGDFIFKDVEDNEFGKAKNIFEFEQLISRIPDHILIHSSDKNHFSSWLMARGEMKIADEIRPIKFSDFPDSKFMQMDISRL
jgi:hypothetical protein